MTEPRYPCPTPYGDDPTLIGCAAIFVGQSGEDDVWVFYDLVLFVCGETVKRHRSRSLYHTHLGDQIGAIQMLTWGKNYVTSI